MSEGVARPPRALRFGRAALRGWRQPQRWRLATGLVLFAFALTHFLNHALGLVSLEVMEAVQEVRSAFWRSHPGTVLLYGSLALHAGLGLWTTLRRRAWRLAPWHLVQVALGLAIPVLGAVHVVATRAFHSLAGADVSYGAILGRLWPEAALAQTAFLAAVWIHSAIGFHIWLRGRAWYASLLPALAALALLIPALATAGWIEAARRLALAPASPADAPPIPADLARLPDLARSGAWIGLGLFLLALVGARVAGRWRRGPAVTYSDGRKVRIPAGATLLEASLAAGQPHAAVCGGRGRCSTCRVQILEGSLPPPHATEAAALARIGAPDRVRLACQVRPRTPLTIRLLVPMRDAQPDRARDPFRWGVERRITVMFADLRGFTSLAERLYPYDSVFLLNRYFELMAGAIERHGGVVDKFLGDGIMALFGTAPAGGAGGAAALRAARAMFEALDTLNEEFGATLQGRLCMGIGLHSGQAVLGRVGGRASGLAPASLTALGDSVNIASRLEALNKEFGSIAVISEAVLASAGETLVASRMHEVPLRGREEMMSVVVVMTPGDLAPAGPVPVPPPTRAGALGLT